MITGFGLAAYAHGLLAFIDYMDYPTAYNAFRSWKINFVAIWIIVGVAATQSLTVFVESGKVTT